MRIVFNQWLLLLFLAMPASLAALEEFLIEGLQINGLQKISEGAVLQNLLIKSGDMFQPEQSTAIIRGLFKTGFFKDIKLSQKEGFLIIDVIERPTISQIIIKGIENNDDLKKILFDEGINEGRIFNDHGLSKAKEAITNYYVSKGHYAVRVETIVKPSLNDNQVMLTIDVYEGDIARLKRINIIGNTPFSQKELLEKLYHVPTNWLSWLTKKNIYSKEKLEADLEILRSYHLNNGFINFKVNSTQVSLTPNKKDVYITINITAGDKYYFDKASIETSSLSKVANLDNILQKITPGKEFSRKLIVNVQRDLEIALGSVGYSRAIVRVVPEIDDERKTVKIVYFIDPLQRVTIRRINILGNLITQDEVLRREIEQMESTWISTEKLIKSKDNLMRRGFVSKVDLDINQVVGTKDQVDVAYKVAEQRSNQLSLSGGFSQAVKVQIKASANLRNFLGTGKDISFNFDNNKVSRTYSFNYYNPFFTLDKIGFGFNAAYNKTELSKLTNVSAYATANTTLDMYWSLPLSEYSQVNLTCSYENNRLFIGDNISNEIKEFMNKNGNHYKAYLLSASWSYNSSDKYIFPTKGFIHNIMARASTPKSKLQYYILSLDSRWYLPINDDYIIRMTYRFGYGDGYGKTGKLPFFKNFYTGGQGSIRGFKENTLGPKDSKNKAFGGNVLIYSSAAFIFPNPINPKAETVRTAFFLDVGQVYDVNSGLHSVNGLRYALGLSLQWNSPLGAPMEFSVSKPINKKSGDEVRILSFSLSTSF